MMPTLVSMPAIVADRDYGFFAGRHLQQRRQRDDADDVEQSANQDERHQYRQPPTGEAVKYLAVKDQFTNLLHWLDD